MSGLVSIVLIVFWFIVILIPLVAIHELGHFLFAKLVGVKVIEYGIGIPPRGIARRWKGVIWSLNWLPLGGFAKIYGDHDAIDSAQDALKNNESNAKEVYTENRIIEILSSGDLEYILEDNNLEYNEEWKKFASYKGNYEDDTIMKSLYNQLSTLVSWEYDEVVGTKSAFCNVSWWRQTVILLGGVTFNLISAVFLLFVIFGFVGTPVFPVLQNDIDAIVKNNDLLYKSEYVKVLRVIKDTPASKSGLKPQDDLIKFNNVEINTLKNFEEFSTLVQSQQSPDVVITYRSYETGAVEEKKVTLEEKDGKYFFGLRSSDLGYLVRYRSKDLGGAITDSAMRTAGIFVLNFKILGDIVVALIPTTQDRSALENVGGPIAVGAFGSYIYELQGIAGILNIMALVSIGLAAFNLLPIPALDGGRFIIVTINALTRRRNKKLENIIISLTFVFMLILAGVIALYDTVRSVTGNLGF